MPKITIYKNKDQKTYNYKEGSLLIDVLREQGFLLDAPCGGNGQCGKCKVRINNQESVDKILKQMNCGKGLDIVFKCWS